MGNTDSGNRRSAKAVFEIARVVSGVPFQIGFCTGWRIHGDQLTVEDAFVHLVLHVPFGTLSCRGPWPRGERLYGEHHMLAPCDWRPWMDLDATDLVAAVDLCAAASIPLPNEGFRRL